jgi:hypothetical protein
MMLAAGFVQSAARQANLPGLEAVAGVVQDMLRGLRQTPTGNYATGARGPKLIELRKQSDGSYST